MQSVQHSRYYYAMGAETNFVLLYVQGYIEKAIL